MKNLKKVKSIEDTLLKVSPEILVYSLVAFFYGALLEAIFPDIKDQTKVSLMFESLVQLFLIVFLFVILNDVYKSRIGGFVFVLVLIGNIPTFFKKIDLLSKRLFKNVATKNNPIDEQVKEETQLYDTKKSEVKRDDVTTEKYEDYEEEEEEEEEDEIEPIGATSIRNLRF
jgi:hypothetical protein